MRRMRPCPLYDKKYVNPTNLEGDLRFTVVGLDDMGDPAATKDMPGIAVLINQEMYKPSLNDIDDKNVFQLCAVLADENNYFTVGGVDFLRLSALDDVNVAEVIENANILCSSATGTPNILVNQNVSQ